MIRLQQIFGRSRTLLATQIDQGLSSHVNSITLQKRHFLRGAFRRSKDPKHALLGQRFRWEKGELSKFIVDYLAWSFLGSCAYYYILRSKALNEMKSEKEITIHDLERQIEAKNNPTLNLETQIADNHVQIVIENPIPINVSF
ncbi:hypothetical protein BB559_004936 [Furculomyces boomerangus]|uniref:Uncharacterized protein n=1 Tax=Furculomyces boomerangus TaxID=61424 RepID=A0A2T9Y693_9FUNG|nr:hypothetical protein BB559_005862 [Furculomyces boomerangus]PVU89807.1 hypothetical protein BB559_004936 [Furculomyces boomerangus]